MLKPRPRPWIRSPGELVECDRYSPAGWFSDRQLVVGAPNVLDEGVAREDHPGAAVLSAHRPQPRLQAAVIALDAVVGVLVGSMPRRRQQLSSTTG
jgi:hypothetical protein